MDITCGSWPPTRYRRNWRHRIGTSRGIRKPTLLWIVYDLYTEQMPDLTTPPT
jgi:hypothetical protein